MDAWYYRISVACDIWNNTKCNILMLSCGPLHLAFPEDVAYAFTNIQQVTYKEEEQEQE
jgi:hypothetical protein